MIRPDKIIVIIERNKKIAAKIGGATAIIIEKNYI